jgi:RNA polymerase sigma-70 factor (ECF subfamily)
MSIAIRYQNESEDAEEVCNDSFLRIVGKLKKYKPNTSFVPWAKRVAINYNIDVLRAVKLKRIEYVKDEYLLNASSHTYNNGSEHLDADLLVKLIQELPQSEKQVFNLFAIDGFSHAEISQLLKIPLGTSKSLLFYARKNLKEKLETMNYLKPNTQHINKASYG